MKKLVLINPRNRVSLYGDYLWQPLALAYVAAATPKHWEVELIDEQCEGMVEYGDVEADLVGLTAFTTQAPRAYRIARQFRSRGIPVVMGGIHASLVPDEIGTCSSSARATLPGLSAGDGSAAMTGCVACRRGWSEVTAIATATDAASTVATTVSRRHGKKRLGGGS